MSFSLYLLKGSALLSKSRGARLMQRCKSFLVFQVNNISSDTQTQQTSLNASSLRFIPKHKWSKIMPKKLWRSVGFPNGPCTAVKCVQFEHWPCERSKAECWKIQPSIAQHKKIKISWLFDESEMWLANAVLKVHFLCFLFKNRNAI